MLSECSKFYQQTRFSHLYVCRHLGPVISILQCHLYFMYRFYTSGFCTLFFSFFICKVWPLSENMHPACWLNCEKWSNRYLCSLGRRKKPKKKCEKTRGYNYKDLVIESVYSKSDSVLKRNGVYCQFFLSRRTKKRKIKQKQA